MTGYIADLSWKSGVRAIEKLDRLRSTMAVNVLRVYILEYLSFPYMHFVTVLPVWTPINLHQATDSIQYTMHWRDTVSGLPEGAHAWPEVKAENGMPELVISYF